eukprot:3566487-Pyramimonas_sp.AAC.1
MAGRGQHWCIVKSGQRRRCHSAHAEVNYPAATIFAQGGLGSEKRARELDPPRNRRATPGRSVSGQGRFREGD